MHLFDRVTLPREPTSPYRARHYLAPKLLDLGMPPDTVAELLVAVGEAVTNAVLYGGLTPVQGPSTAAPGTGDPPPSFGGFGDGHAAPAPADDVAAAQATANDVVVLELIARGDRIAVAVTSSRTGWRVPDPVLPADALAMSGRGFFIMQHFSDSLRIEQKRGGTTVYLIRRIGSGPGGIRPPGPASRPHGRRRAG